MTMEKILIPNKNIRDLNLDCIIQRMTDTDLVDKKSIRGGWSLEEALTIAQMYKVFLLPRNLDKN